MGAAPSHDITMGYVSDPFRTEEYLSQDQAYELLKQYTGQDFGYDSEQWETWLAQHPESIRHSPRRTDV